MLPIATPLGFLLASGSASVPSDFVRLAVTPQLDNEGLQVLGLLAFAALMIILAISLHRIWRKSGMVMATFTELDSHRKWSNYHVLWFGPALAAPLLLALWALLGYFYSAAFILSVAGETLWFIVGAIIAKDLLMRSLYVTQRQLRFQEALRHRDELNAQRATGSEDQNPGEDRSVEAIEDEKVDYRQLGDQVRSLVQFGYTLSLLAGLWWIWRDVFPAFSFLDGIELPITTSKLVDGVTQDVALTLGDMVAGLLLGGLALFAAMKIPAVLELTLLQRLPLSRASRYAVTTLLQYIVAMLGLLISFNALGLQWSNIQWLVAALSVGLGFGLQEIVANFISGIILLFEQPIRVGDVVTVDGTTGTVSKIRIRATTIVNYDRQELVIPNKTFITGQLINWTLSDTVNRIFITVGVSYASDTREAMTLIREAAVEHPNVMQDPEPKITFEAFGDNALTLNLRAYLADMDRRLATITELHQSILDKFREAEIEISFPQRDVHLTTIEPLELKLKR
jgi:potassium efflux system protein